MTDRRRWRALVVLYTVYTLIFLCSGLDHGSDQDSSHKIGGGVDDGRCEISSYEQVVAKALVNDWSVERVRRSR